MVIWAPCYTCSPFSVNLSFIVALNIVLSSLTTTEHCVLGSYLTGMPLFKSIVVLIQYTLQRQTKQLVKEGFMHYGDWSLLA